MAVNKETVKSRVSKHNNLQKRKENNCFDTKKFSKWFHWCQLSLILLVKKYQTVHSHHLSNIVDHKKVYVGVAKAEFAFPVDANSFKEPAKTNF